MRSKLIYFACDILCLVGEYIPFWLFSRLNSYLAGKLRDIIIGANQDA